MGCDIHVYTEFKPWYGKREGEWFSADNYRLNPSFDEEDKYESKMNVVPIYGERNYTLFSILADVRNYGENEPISEPRGLPEDCCPEIKKESDSWEVDGHSHSYFTLKELMDYQKNHPLIQYQGYVTGEASANLDKGIFPTEYWQDGNITGQVWRKWKKPNDAMQPLIDALIEREKELFWIFSDKPEAIEGHANDIRIVFWFDN